MNFLDKIFWENSVKEWIISLLMIVVAIIANKLVVLLNRTVLRKISAKSSSKIDNILLDSLEKPVMFGIMLVAVWFATARLNMETKIHNVIETAYHILIVLNVTWGVSKFSSLLISEYGGRISNRLLPLIKRTVLTIIWIIGSVTALNNIGVGIASILGVLGVGGVSIALAAQDTLKNIFSGITIVTDSPFSIGDIIQFDSYEGVVQDIGLRSTRILTYEQRIVSVPNYKLMDASIINISAEPSRRVVIKLGLTYDTSPQKMQEAIAILKKIPEIVSEIEINTVAVFSDFGDFALGITYIYYIKKNLDIRESTSKVNFEILNNFSEAGLNFAFPTQTAIIKYADNADFK
ncbi:MAG: mechanosensitive ion channel family protein [Prevotellaceae bacterium]|jgi:MscS family membrane protein|nr:mechanosensitive ion channel family protein [Prevotellaceae bacterium]